MSTTQFPNWLYWLGAGALGYVVYRKLTEKPAWQPNPDPEEFDRVCSYCRRIFEEGEWVPGEPTTKWVTHGICDDCMVQVMRDIEEEERRMGKR